MTVNTRSGNAIRRVITDDYPRRYEGTVANLTKVKEENVVDFIKTGFLPIDVDNYNEVYPTAAREYIVYDKNDEYSVYAWNNILAKYATGNINSSEEEAYEAFAKIYKEKTGKSIDAKNGDKILDEFSLSSKFFYESPEVCVYYCRLAAERIKIWHKYTVVDGNDIGGSFGLIEDIENVSSSEEKVINNPNSFDTLAEEGRSQLNQLSIKIYARTVMGQTIIDDPTVERAFATRSNAATPERVGAFYRTFSKVNPAAFAEDGLSVDALSQLMVKIETSGLLELASYAYEIGEFARKRFTSKQKLEQPLYGADGQITFGAEVHLPWLQIIGEVTQRLRRDPLGFAAISFYFPSLVTFLIDAIAAAGDYTNNGQGGGMEDEEAFVNSLERAFGMNEDGKAIFKMAFKMSSTSERINRVLEKSPFRRNKAPKSPDIFHLRVGAANFYVPPVTIDVNSAFKTGSLTGGAIRQKNSPKFNTGYRETTVRLRLFFPNYEEIWGIKIDDASTIRVNEDYEIDFKRGGASDAKIDKFLSSLRGLVAAFRYSPILPIKNHYLNTVHGITGVALSNMTISTIPNFPFALAVDLELLNFNHAPFLPMIKDFNQAVHWGKYRQYMGKAAGALHQYVNESFLIKTSESKQGDQAETLGEKVDTYDAFYGDEGKISDPSTGGGMIPSYQNDVLTQNVAREWQDGNHIVFYVPAETQTKVFLPDTSSFRSEQEKIFTDLGEGLWDNLLKRLGIDINQSASYGISLPETVQISESSAFSKTTMDLIKDSIELMIAGVNTDDNVEKSFQFLATSFIQENNNRLSDEQKTDFLDFSTSTAGSPNPSTYTFSGLFLGGSDGISLDTVKIALKQIARNPQSYLDWITNEVYEDTKRKSRGNPDFGKVQQDVARAFSVTLYERFFKSGPIQSLMDAAREKAGNFQFNEWEVPMIKVSFDKKAVIVNGVTVTMANNFAKLQIQMQDEPSYQHIGGKDSYINISMTVIGEAELIKLKNIFDHLSGLARLEHATGVIGFLGIKNIITALSGIKYVLPLNYKVSTIPNYPHAYNVELSLVDFDIFQQTREKLDNTQQKELVKQFSKRNPFLRIKQLWGAFNAYPDFPLEVKNEKGEIVGHLDPDFYFRSFEMLDRDVVNNIQVETPRVQDYSFNPSLQKNIGQIRTSFNARVQVWLREYRSAGVRDSGAAETDQKTLRELVDEIYDFYKSTGLSIFEFASLFDTVIANEGDGYTRDFKTRLLTDFLDMSSIQTEENSFMVEVNSAAFKQGDLSPNAASLRVSIEAMLSGEYSLKNEEEVSFDPDEVDFHKLIYAIPAADEKGISEGKIPAVCATALGLHYGYIERSTGRFYLTVNGVNVVRGAKEGEEGYYKFKSNLLEDTQTPDRGNTVANTGVPGVQALSGYQNAYESGSLYAQMEKIMVDTSYRDISGRMLRAFPTYMLWLIDEGGYFAGVKLFDNFYGLQSIIDFSVVSSEDLLGDTLVLRVSNMYSKLTTPESSKIFNPNLDTSSDPTLSEGLAGIIDRTLNISKNILSHMRNEYVVDIANIRLKPGVRVHLRAGYGSNPNSLQTVFNGVITNVEPGEIVTITAQSDAIELGAVINSTNKKGDSGKIDGGIDTGLWMSEPRDLMVRLLSMGASRFREAISRANRGMVFSENRFGIRHFGSVLYEPLNKDEQEKSDAIRGNVEAAMKAAGSNSSFAKKTIDITSGFAMNTRGNTLEAVGQLWANFSSEVDLEIFKRNIYPGNGTGMAQFLGNDLDDGWLTASSLTSQDNYNERLDGHLGRLTDIAWNNVLASSQSGSTTANSALESLTQDSQLIGNSRAGLVKGAFGVGLAAGVAALTGPIGGIAVGAGLLGVLRGRGGTSIFKTMGILGANDDDDLPGFDEVSFRAQTYMRTVWDVFQTCSRLLPNYIVAVRPFEDRSTVFYGKPHWLYTSGVVPVTTGFPNEEDARALGITVPKLREPDMALVEILDSINRGSSPLADYAAFYESFEPNETFESIGKQIAQSEGTYAPTSRLSGKVLNFNTIPAMKHIDKDGKTIAVMPKTKGMVNVGLHLPVIPESGRIDDAIQNQQDHKQLDNLPPRYRFPFFAATEDLILEEFPEVQVLTSYDTREDDFLRTVYNAADRGLDGLSAYKDSNFYNNLTALTALELIFFKENKLSLTAKSDTILLDMPMNLIELNQYSAEPFLPDAQIVRMPFPSVRSENSLNENNVTPAEVNQDYSFEYQPENYGQFNYSEWGAPQTAEDEQFYIAMRWPYKPPVEGVEEKFRAQYDLGDLYGTAQDYKNRKVLVYNPANGRAVVCRPAYFMWGENEDTDAIVSPDAAYFLGIITKNPGELTPDILDQTGATLYESSDIIESSGFRLFPVAQECYMAFVLDDIPVGAVATTAVPITEFRLKNADGEAIEKDEEYLVGFGRLKSSESFGTATRNQTEMGNIREERYISGVWRDSLRWFTAEDDQFSTNVDSLVYGGNPLEVNDKAYSYFQAVLEGEFDPLAQEKLYELRINEKEQNPDPFSGARKSFIPVYSPSDMIGVQAAAYYYEDFDAQTNVIAGDGRTLKDADNIWGEFRTGYHNFESAKAIFYDVYGLDPDSDEPFPAYLSSIINGEDVESDPIKKFSNTGNSTGIDEFAILLGSDYVGSLPTGDGSTTGGGSRAGYAEAVEFARQTWIDAPSDQGGLVEYFNSVIVKQLKAIHENFLTAEIIGGVAPAGEDGVVPRIDPEKMTSKKLFYLMVGIFRQRLWEDPYARAWLVLKPDRKREFLGTIGGGDGEEGRWSFKPVDKVFREFINPYNDLAKPSKKTKFLQLLVATRSEGNSSTDIVLDAVEGVSNFFETNIGPIWSSITDGLSALMSMFKLNMQQMGYALSEAGNLAKQAHIMNKVLNDSIYYSLGRPGSLLRAVDNPFTREYGEPVIEVREPFQRLHYLSSFSHILTNHIQENLNNVATVVTAVSDGKYPVTVALDKGAPAERQTEKTVETGIFFDNVVGSGFTGFLHPFFHPFETFRGVSKNIQGTPDELSARRIALAHLKESIKDIYGGELLIIGNTDIRPHDLVYIADVYERMYGIFEVEQVIHHFTSELGFVTAITPNALVTVNDPARWFISSWFDSWMNVQTIRNDTRLYLDNMRTGNSGISLGGDVSIEALNEALSPQITGGLQYTHGSTALVKDLMANQTAMGLPGSQETNISPPASETGVGKFNVIAGALASMTPIVGQLAWKGWTWVRDNVLDQHGCYVQYLNKNGQPMDAGLSYNQGMVVGRYHSKALLPGILGVRSKVRTPEGYAYVRSDDLFRSLGWREKELKDLVRYVSYENALVHARVLKLAGLGPEQASLQLQFKVICKLVKVIDGDTIEVQDCLSDSSSTFRVRFDGINTAELNEIRGPIEYAEPTPTEISIIDYGSPAGRAKLYTKKALEDRLFVLRISPNRAAQITPIDESYDAGSTDNIIGNWEKDDFDNPRVIATIFHYLPPSNIAKIKSSIADIVRSKLGVSVGQVTAADLKNFVKNNFYDTSPFRLKFEQLYNNIDATIDIDFFDYSAEDSISNLSPSLRKVFNNLVYMRILEEIYNKASSWPLTSWDEYYENGYPVTLNWELVVNNLAAVYVKDLQTESDSVLDANETAALPTRVEDD